MTTFAEVLDYILVFALPSAVFTIQWTISQHYEYGMAWSLLTGAGFYMALGWLLYRQYPERFSRLAESFAGIGIVLATLVLPFAFEETTTATAWAAEGALLVYFGLRRRYALSWAAGVVLQMVATVLLAGQIGAYSHDSHPLLNPWLLGMLVASASLLMSAYWLRHENKPDGSWESVTSSILLAGGLLWWTWAGIGEITRIDGQAGFHAVIAFMSATALVCVVGMLLLLVGYLAPVPPAGGRAETEPSPEADPLPRADGLTG